MLPKSVQNKIGNGATGVSNATGIANGEMPKDVIKSGYLKKLKTMKKKFFVLRCETEAGPARLEYYDNEKKWRLSNVTSGPGAPKRSIALKTCFNINKKVDSKQKHAIALYTRDDCFAVAMESDVELEEWLTLFLALQQGHTDADGDLTLLDKESKPKPNFEHVWQVTVKSKGLGSSKSIAGPHRLCLTSTTLSLIKMNSDTDALEFPLMSIRRCGHSDCFFFMELGRSACTGAGELWMQTEDTIIAQNTHEAILGAMKSSRSHEDLGPLARPRSSSTSDNSKMITTRSVGVVNPQMTVSNNSVSALSMASMERGPAAMSHPVNNFGPRDRCDSMPTRSRTVSEGHHDIPPRSSYYFEMTRPHSTYNHSISYSPPVANNPLSPSSGAYSDSAGSSLSIDDFESPSDYHHRYLGHPSECTVHTEPTITEEGNDDYQSMTPEAFDNSDSSGIVIDNQPHTHHSSINAGTDYLQMKGGANVSDKLNQRSSLTSMFLNLNTGSQDASFNNPQSPSYANAAKSSHSSIIGGGRLSGLSQVDSSKRSSSNTSGYIEMTSPSTPSLPNIEGYLPMSPGTSININQHGLKGNYSHEPDSHGSYAGSDWSDAYMPMDPSDESRSGSYQRQFDSQNHGYIEMRMHASSLPKSGYALMGNTHLELSSPSRSTNSLQDMSCSCSPAEMEGFHLDKVKSFFPPSEDDSDDYIKPVRAYSIGSRPQVRKTHLSSHLDQHRVRAYSFGSQAHTGGSRSSESTRQRGAASNSGYSGIDVELGSLRTLDSKVSKKSSSAPLLPSRPHNPVTGTWPANVTGNNASMNNTSAGPARIIRPNSSSRNEHNEDLMEINYQHPTPVSSTSSTFSRVKSQDGGDGDHSRRFSSNGSRPRTNSRSSTSSALAAALSVTTSHISKKEDAKQNELPAKKGTHNESLHRGTSLDSSKYFEQQFHFQKDQAQSAVAVKDPAYKNDYMEMAPDATVSKKKHTVKKQQPSPQQKPKTNNLTVAIESESTGSGEISNAPVSPGLLSGDYVNLDMSKVTWQLNNSFVANPTPFTTEISVPTLENPSENQFSVHSYMNLGSAQPTAVLEPATQSIVVTPASSSYSDYAIMSPGSCLDAPDKISGLIHAANEKKGILCTTASNNIRKQMSASSVPALTNLEPKSPGRKSSCPVTSSAANTLPESPNHPLLLPSRSPIGSIQSINRSSVSSLLEELSESSTISGLSDSVASLCNSAVGKTETAYENMLIGPPIAGAASGGASGLPVPRPLSVSSERELNYASLDLAPPVATNLEDDKQPRSPRMTKPIQASASGAAQAHSGEENGNLETNNTPLSYAEIDFTKSEGLRNISGSLREGRV